MWGKSKKARINDLIASSEASIAIADIKEELYKAIDLEVRRQIDGINTQLKSVRDNFDRQYEEHFRGTGPRGLLELKRHNRLVEGWLTAFMKAQGVELPKDQE